LKSAPLATICAIFVYDKYDFSNGTKHSKVLRCIICGVIKTEVLASYFGLNCYFNALIFKMKTLVDRLVKSGKARFLADKSVKRFHGIACIVGQRGGLEQAGERH